MKRIISTVLIFTLLFTGSVFSYAYDESESETKTDCEVTVDNIPETSTLQHLNVTFFITNGRADVSYFLTMNKKAEANIEILVEKKTLGFLWSDVGRKSETVRNLRYYSGSCSVPVAGSGQYRVTVTFYAPGDKISKVVLFDYDESIFLGDVNADNRINAMDARLILRCAARLEKFTEKQKSFADMDSDGRITAADARLALRVAAKL